MYHHINTLIIVYFLNHHYNGSSIVLDTTEKSQLIKDVLSVEISNIFLSMHHLLKDKIENRPENELENRGEGIVQKANQLLFIVTFTYFRIYHYTVYILLSKKINLFILLDSKNVFHQYSIFIALYGFFLLNSYWFFLIMKKVFLDTRVGACKKGIERTQKTKEMH